MKVVICFWVRVGSVLVCGEGLGFFYVVVDSSSFIFVGIGFIYCCFFLVVW